MLRADPKLLRIKNAVIKYTKTKGAKVKLPLEWLEIWDFPKELKFLETAPFLVFGTEEAWRNFDFVIIEKDESI